MEAITRIGANPQATAANTSQPTDRKSIMADLIATFAPAGNREHKTTPANAQLWVGFACTLKRLPVPIPGFVAESPWASRRERERPRKRTEREITQISGFPMESHEKALGNGPGVGIISRQTTNWH
jgi:hypothetical protein